MWWVVEKSGQKKKHESDAEGVIQESCNGTNEDFAGSRLTIPSTFLPANPEGDTALAGSSKLARTIKEDNPKKRFATCKHIYH
jgi:hypothetical protein